MRILFVDDNFETRDLFRLCFSMAGHTAQTADDGREALRFISEHSDPLDVIIMDYHMPGMNGLEVVEQLREMHKFESVPIILFTGDTRGQMEGKAQELGVARVVYKPLTPSDLLAAAQEAINGVRMN